MKTRILPPSTASIGVAIGIDNLAAQCTAHRVAGIGRLSGTTAESLIAFGERVFASFCDKNFVFYNCGKTSHLWLSKDTGTFPQTPFLMFRYVLWLCSGCTKALQKWALQKLYEIRRYESSLKALRKLSESSLKTLWKLYESYLNAGSPKALRKQADFCWKPFKKLT